jgi:hypothetical protein
MIHSREQLCSPPMSRYIDESCADQLPRSSHPIETKVTYAKDNTDGKENVCRKLGRWSDRLKVETVRCPSFDDFWGEARG